MSEKNIPEHLYISDEDEMIRIMSKNIPVAVLYKSEYDRLLTARRITLCVNKCKGIPTENLENIPDDYLATCLHLSLLQTKESMLAKQIAIRSLGIAADWFYEYAKEHQLKLNLQKAEHNLAKASYLRGIIDTLERN